MMLRIPNTYNQIKHLLHSLLQVVLMAIQQANMMLQRYTKHPFSPFISCITRYIFLIIISLTTAAHVFDQQ